jgi:hypothetical protein
MPFGLKIKRGGKQVKTERQKTLKVGSKIGALAGGILFLIFGLVPAFYFGSFGTMTLLSHLTGGPVEPGVIARAIVVVGTLLGLFCAAASSIVVGSVMGTALAFVADTVTGVFGTKEMAAEAETSAQTE